jgi:hypothetical protein
MVTERNDVQIAIKNSAGWKPRWLLRNTIETCAALRAEAMLAGDTG